MMAERRDARGYLIALAAMAMALSVRWPLYPVLGENRPYLTLFAAVAFAVWVARWRPATVAAIVGFFGANYFLAGPQPAFTLDSLFVFDLVGYALSAGLIVFFGESLHRERERAEHEHTQRKEAEELERRQKELLRVTLASIGDGVIVTDAEGRISFLNAEAERLTGWSASDAAGQPLLDVFDIVNEDTRARAENPVDEALRTNAVVGLANHTVLRSKDGSETPIEDSAAPIRAGQELPSGVVLVFRDVSAQRLAQRSNARLAAIIDNSGDAIFTKDLNGVIQTWNAGATKLFGYLPEEIIGKPIMLLVPPHLAGEESQILARLRAGQPSEYIETTRVARDGRHIPVSVSVSPLRDGDGTVIGASKIVRDITDIIAAREALARKGNSSPRRSPASEMG